MLMVLKMQFLRAQGKFSVYSTGQSLGDEEEESKDSVKSTGMSGRQEGAKSVHS